MSKILTMAVVLVAAAAGQMEPHAAEFMRSARSSMTRMDQEMAAAPMDGDIDHDFASMMVPHHQGAIDMAKAELIYGKDPVMRRLAQEILVDQQSEIDVMQLWLRKNGYGSATKEK